MPKTRDISKTRDSLREIIKDQEKPMGRTIDWVIALGLTAAITAGVAGAAWYLSKEKQDYGLQLIPAEKYKQEEQIKKKGIRYSFEKY